MSHAEAIQKSHDVLLRCTTINLYVIDFLRARDVLDDEQESDLKAERSHLRQRILLFQWLKIVSSDKYESFLQVMKDTEQEHVANILTGSTDENQLPLSDSRYARLLKIRHNLAEATHIDIELIAELRSSRAISRTDAEEIRAETVDYAKISKLISAIMRRSNYSYYSFQEGLRKTQQTKAAEFLIEGEMPAVHLNNNRPDLDGPLSLALNGVIRNRTTDDAEIKELLAEMNGLGFNLVNTKPGESIVIFIYCRTVHSAVKFTQLFNSGRLKNILEGILNRLLLVVEPHTFKKLDSRISLGDEDVIILEEFTGIEGWMTESLHRPKPFGSKYTRDSTTQTDGVSLMRKFTGWLNESRHRPKLLGKKNSRDSTTLTGDLFLAFENPKTEGEILEGTKEKQQQRDMLAPERYISARTQQRHHKLQLPRHFQDEELHEQLGLYQHERSKEKSLESTGFEIRSENKSDPVFVQTIRTKAAEDGKKSIRGLTILDKELFVVCELRSEIEVYDSMNLGLSRRWNLKELINPQDIESCKINKCLYISDYKVAGQSKEILRVGANGQLIKKWLTGEDWGYGLSVTSESNVILTVCNKNKINEYSSDGQWIREINLPSDANICYPFHAIKLTNGHFVVCYCGNNDLNGVCIVDAEGKTKKSFGGKLSTFGQIIRPVYLATDGNGFVMVADQRNGRVLLLDSDLEFKREILSSEMLGLREPEMILLDESRGRLFVADNYWDEGEILIFEYK